MLKLYRPSRSGLAGDAAQAARLAADLAKRFPEDTIVQFNYLPTIHAATALQGGSATKAIEALVPVAPYELGSAGHWSLSTPSTCVAKLIWRRTKAAQPQPSFRKFSTTLASSGMSPIGALAHLGLARAYALSGDTAKARPLIRTSSPSGKTPTPTSPS